MFSTDASDSQPTSRSEYSEYLTVKEVGRLFNVSCKTVTRRFADEPGVVNFGVGRNRILRIPRYVVDRFIQTRACLPAVSIRAVRGR